MVVAVASPVTSTDCVADETALAFALVELGAVRLVGGGGGGGDASLSLTVGVTELSSRKVGSEGAGGAAGLGVGSALGTSGEAGAACASSFF